MALVFILSLFLVLALLLVLDGPFLQHDIGELFFIGFANHTTVHSLREGTPGASGEGTGLVVGAGGDREGPNVAVVQACQEESEGGTFEARGRRWEDIGEGFNEGE